MKPLSASIPAWLRSTKSPYALNASLVWINGALMLAIVATMLVTFFPIYADDAYIVARYARHLIDGNGLTYNLGERVNALTSPLHVFVVAAIQVLAVEAITGYRLLAAALVVGTFLAVARFAMDSAGDRLMFLALTLASPFVLFWSVGGLETPMLCCVCTIFTVVATRGSSDSAAWVIVLAGTAILLRFDASLFVAPAAALTLWRYRKSIRIAAYTIVTGLTIVGWLWFSLTYFGDVLPTSYYVKSPWQHQGGLRIGLGALYLVSAATFSLAWAVRFAGTSRTSKRKAESDATILAICVGLALEGFYGIFAGTQHMMYAYRLYVPYLPSLVFLLVFQCRPGKFKELTCQVVVSFILVVQASLGAFLYFESENPNASIFVMPQRAGDELYEFSTLGAKYTTAFLDAVRGSADVIQRHWKGQIASSQRSMRIRVDTGGVLPFLLPDAYVIEPLVSYRHHCQIQGDNVVDYRQVIRFWKVSEDDPPISNYSPAKWTRISHQQVIARGFQNETAAVSVEIWFQREPAASTLPPTVNESCISVLG